MKKVFSSDNSIMAGHVQSLLEANDIECHLRNMNLTGGIGELPINECWPEVWIYNEADSNLAELIISNALATSVQNDDWQCQCGESIEGSFEICWACGKESKT